MQDKVVVGRQNRQRDNKDRVEVEVPRTGQNLAMEPATGTANPDLGKDTLNRNRKRFLSSIRVNEPIPSALDLSHRP